MAFLFKKKDWLDKKKQDTKIEEKQYKYVWDKAGFVAINGNEVDYALGMYAEHYDIEEE